MPTEAEQKDIDAINKTVLSALEMLMGAGGHKQGFKGLKSSRFAALKVAKGIATDHTHRGYKDVTMRAFQIGLQRILDDYFVALKLLEGNAIEDPGLKQKLSDPANRNYILKILGFSKSDRELINKVIQYQTELDENQIFDAIKQALNVKGEAYKQDRLQRIELMITGAMCYLPFSEPNDGHLFNIPVKDLNGTFQYQGMQVERINMNPGIGGPYHALYLQPVGQGEKYAQDQVVFMGTNPLPTSSGPSVTIHADTISGNSIGENFVQASEERFEKLFKAQYKKNLSDLIKNHLNDFKLPNGDINFEKLWLAARVKCTGQSLGGSIPLQMLVKFPFMVETHAFEPPFLLEKHRQEMEENIANAHQAFEDIIVELLQESDDNDKNLEHTLNQLNDAFPKRSEKLNSVLKQNNIVIAQMIDYATKFGTLSPPVKILHVDTNRSAPNYSNIKDAIYKRVMAFSLLSHAMVLAGQNDKEIKELDNLDELFSHRSRRKFTRVLNAVVWKAINKPMSGYIHLKNYILNHAYDPKLNPSKHPKYLEANREILAQQIHAKWETIQRALADIDSPESWRSGDHLKYKIDELSRMLTRAEQLGVNTDEITSGIRTAFNSINNAQANRSEKREIYISYLMHATNPPAMLIQQAFQARLLEITVNYLNAKPIAVSSIIEMYAMLDKESRKNLIGKIKQNLKAEPDNKAITDLVGKLAQHAQRNSEKSSLKALTKPHSDHPADRPSFISSRIFRVSEQQKQPEQVISQESTFRNKPRQ